MHSRDTQAAEPHIPVAFSTPSREGTPLLVAGRGCNRLYAPGVEDVQQPESFFKEVFSNHPGLAVGGPAGEQRKQLRPRKCWEQLRQPCGTVQSLHHRLRRIGEAKTAERQDSSVAMRTKTIHRNALLILRE